MIYYILLIALLSLETHVISKKLLMVEKHSDPISVDIEFELYNAWCKENNTKPGHADSLMIYLNEEAVQELMIEILLEEDLQ